MERLMRAFLIAFLATATVSCAALQRQNIPAKQVLLPTDQVYYSIEAASTTLAEGLSDMDADIPRVSHWDLMRDAYTESNTNVQYAVVGDSTRDNGYNNLIRYYYPHMLGKLNISLIDSAGSGQSARDWGTDADSPNVTELIAAIDGTGNDCIVEYSLGINDYSLTTDVAVITGWITNGIETLYAAKPDIKLILVNPVYTASEVRNALLTEVYDSISDQYRVPFINGHDVIRIVYDGTTDKKFCVDVTHPTAMGSMRLVNHIFDQILPLDLYGAMTLDHDYRATVSTNDFASNVITGYWSSSTGAFVDNQNARCFAGTLTNLLAGHMLYVQHDGDRTDVIFMGDGDFVDVNSGWTNAVESEWRDYLIPYGADEARINVTLTGGADYDALGAYTNLVRYAGGQFLPSQRIINQRMPVRMLSESEATAWVDPPSESTQVGWQGEYAFDTNGFYLCVSNDLWLKAVFTNAW